MVRAQPGRIQEHLGLPFWWKGPTYLGHLPLLSQGYQEGSPLEVEQPELEPAPEWETGIAGSDLNHCSTKPAHENDS